MIRVHKKPDDHDDEVETDQENQVPKTTSAELDNAVIDLNLENTVIQTAAEEAEEEHEVMTNMEEDDEFEDVPQQTRNINNEAISVLRSA